MPVPGDGSQEPFVVHRGRPSRPRPPEGGPRGSAPTRAARGAGAAGQKGGRGQERAHRQPPATHDAPDLTPAGDREISSGASPAASSVGSVPAARPHRSSGPGAAGHQPARVRAAIVSAHAPPGSGHTGPPGGPYPSGADRPPAPPAPGPRPAPPVAPAAPAPATPPLAPGRIGWRPHHRPRRRRPPPGPPAPPRAAPAAPPSAPPHAPTSPTGRPIPPPPGGPPRSVTGKPIPPPPGSGGRVRRPVLRPVRAAPAGTGDEPARRAPGCPTR